MLFLAKKVKASALRAVMRQPILKQRVRKLKNLRLRNSTSQNPRIKQFFGVSLAYKKYANFKFLQKTSYTRSKYKLKEHDILKNYANIYVKNTLLTKYRILGKLHTKPTPMPPRPVGYMKHLVRLRYRWHFRHELGQFKLFRKFFRRSLKRYRKIQKNRLFITKVRRNFSKLTGFNEKFIYYKWLKFRRGFNQYWAVSNAVLRFSQSLMLAPYGFLVIIQAVPSLAASKYIVNSGAVTVNGITATSFSTFIPGDMMQLNIVALRAARGLFNYQKWSEISSTRTIPAYIHSDWSSMLFSLLRWPHAYELIAPSFLSERWVRYYVRNFPLRSAKFRSYPYNTKIYKEVAVKK